MSHKILVPLDGTEVGEAVLPKLEQLVFKNLPVSQVQVTLLHVISNVNFNVLTKDEGAQLPYNAEDLSKLQGEAGAYLGKIAGALKNKGVSVNTMVAVGHPGEQIVKTALEIGADLITMVTRSRNKLARLVMSSVTSEVMKLGGKIPVLAISAPKDGESTVVPVESIQSLVKYILAKNVESAVR